MLTKRVIPILLINEYGDLIKGRSFKKHKYVGDPINAVKIFNEKEVDELVILDITATKTNKINFKLIEEIASQAFMPLSYGGGIKRIEDVEKILYLGFEKVVLNTVNFEDLKFLKKCSEIFGSSTIIGSIDYKKKLFSGNRVYKNNGTKVTKYSPEDFAKIIELNGAGELFCCNIQREGSAEGYDLKTIGSIVNNATIPVIAAGGAGSLEDIKQIFLKTNVSAAAAGDLFIYYGVHKAVLISYPEFEVLKDIINN
tara:strand:+ start:4558 stop:5322 length:765 start_codon:yes stop_codon:yes gene_type:complete